MRLDRRSFLGGMAMLSAAGCVSVAPEDAAVRARRLYGQSIVINGNLVAPLDDTGPLDAETAAQVRASGLTAAKVTIGGPGTESRAEVRESIAGYAKAVEMSDGLYSKITRDADFDAAKAADQVGLIFSFEAAEMLEGDVAAIDEFRAMDVMVMGLSYNLNTPFASGVMSKEPTGLTALGREAVARMNARGVTLDISHSDEASSLSAIEASTKPVTITHAGCAAVHPHPRNKSDRLMRALAGKGGVMGLYELAYLTTPGQPTLDVYMAHLLHALTVCGEDHVGIGSDAILTPFDTSPESMAQWDASIEARRVAGVAAPGEGPPPFVIGLNRPDRMVVIAEALMRRGYSDRAVQKVLGLNFRRVFAETWTA